MLFQSNGPVNQILSFFSNSKVELVWLSVPHLALTAVIAADVWEWTPLVFLILLAGILAVPEDQLRAATMLGASWPQRFRRIVLPRMRTVIIIVLVLRCVEAFKLFDVMFVMTRGGPGTSTETISLYIYKQTFNELEWSYVAAIGLTLLVILSVLAVIGMRFMKREIEIEKSNGARDNRRKDDMSPPNIELIWDAKNELGEGPLWDTREQTLYWLDSKGPTVNRYNSRNGSVRHGSFRPTSGRWHSAKKGAPSLHCAMVYLNSTSRLVKPK